MWRFKGCPKCKGDMLVDRDLDGWYGWCLQCGYRHALVGIITVRPQVKVEKGAADNA